jgi:hypothetical protein
MTMRPRPDVSCIAEACNGSSAGELCLYFVAQPGLLEARCARSHRRKAWLSDFQSSGSHGVMPHKGDERRWRVGARVASLAPFVAYAFGSTRRKRR